MQFAPLTTEQVYRALEAYAPQARPYNFDDLFDCWGLVRRVFADLLGGYEFNEQLSDEPAGEANWRLVGARDELLPGDVITTHAHPDSAFHVVIYYGKLGGHHLVYDSSPRGDIPLFSADFALIDQREIFTRYGRASETTDRLRNDGGAYLRLWSERGRYVNRAVHAALLAGGGCAPIDPRQVRIAMGLSPLPFYNLRRLPADALGRESYDNRFTRRQNYYVPAAAPLDDEAYWHVCVVDDWSALEPRPAAPRFLSTPAIMGADVPLRFVWNHDGRDLAGRHLTSPVDSWRFAIVEETLDICRLYRWQKDLDAAATSLVVPADELQVDTKYAGVLWAHNVVGWSAEALTTFLYRPHRSNPLLAYNPALPFDLTPDLGGQPVPAGDVVLAWCVTDAAADQAAARLELYADGGRQRGEAPLHSAVVSGDDALATAEELATSVATAMVAAEQAGGGGLSGGKSTAGDGQFHCASGWRCAYRLPASLTLEAGQEYFWYLWTTNAHGVETFAPVEAVLSVLDEAVAPDGHEVGGE